ncbi:MAG: hypothetical protein WDO19_30835 [Bacteroidota bacterium]
MLDSVNATVWRVIVETVYNWEDKNDNNDPFVFNWDYYNQLYATPKYQKAWDMIAYLNKRGITKNLMINFMGPIPLWMGGKVVKEKYEDEYIEMLVSFFYYAKKTKHLQIGLISIMNEPDIENEGPTVDGEQYARLQRKFIDRMKSFDMGDIQYVAPDVAGMDNGLKSYIPALMKDPVVMSKIAHIGLHSYGGYYVDVDSALKHSAYPQTDYWMTEWNNWCKGCDDGILGEYNYDFAAKSVGYLLSFYNMELLRGLYGRDMIVIMSTMLLHPLAIGEYFLMTLLQKPMLSGKTSMRCNKYQNLCFPVRGGYLFQNKARVSLYWHFIMKH